MKNAKKSMFITTILMVAVLIVAVSTATFAWYTASGTGSATGAVVQSAASGDANIAVDWVSNGIACWKKQMDECDCVIKNRLDWRGRIVLVLCCAVAIVVYALILRRLGGAQAFVDSSTTVFSVAAMILTVKRCIEQWLLWIAVNFISVLMWLRVYLEKGNSIAILLWWLIMLITGVIFFANWLREMRGNPEANLFPENPELESGISYCRRNPDR